ncbi:MAG: hypothetical protein WBN94_00920 [Methanothrix sp.]
MQIPVRCQLKAGTLACAGTRPCASMAGVLRWAGGTLAEAR